MKTCKNCGAVYEGKLCPDCGTPPEEETAVEENPLPHEEPKPLIYKEIENKGFEITWQEHNTKFKKYFKITDWVSNLLWLPMIIFIIVFFVKFFMFNGADFKQLSLTELPKKRNDYIEDLSLWSAIVLAFFLIDSNVDSIPALIKNHFMIKWVKQSDVDLTVYLKRQRIGSQQLPYDMGTLTECVYFCKNNSKYKIKLFITGLYFVISLALSVYLFVNLNNLITWFVDSEIFKQLKTPELKPDSSLDIITLVALGLFIISFVIEKILNNLTYKASIRWAKNYQ